MASGQSQVKFWADGSNNMTTVKALLYHPDFSSFFFSALGSAQNNRSTAVACRRTAFSYSGHCRTAITYRPSMSFFNFEYKVHSSGFYA